MIETIRQLCQVLSRSPLSAWDVAQSIGTLVLGQVQEKQAPLIVKPSNIAFKEALIVRDIGQDSPAYVELKLAQPGGLSLKALRDSFGDYAVAPRLHPNGPFRALIYVDIPKQPFSCVIIAQITPGRQGINDGILTAVTIRRDPRLPE